MTFVDLSKVLDSVDRKTLRKRLGCSGCSERCIRIVRNFHDSMTASIRCGVAMSNPFNVGHAVKQRCVLVPTLFTIFLVAVLQSMPKNIGDVYIRTRCDGDLFNLRRLKDPSCCNGFWKTARAYLEPEGDPSDNKDEKVYRAIVMPTLLYSCGTWTLYRHHFRRLDQV